MGGCLLALYPVPGPSGTGEREWPLILQRPNVLGSGTKVLMVEFQAWEGGVGEQISSLWVPDRVHVAMPAGGRQGQIH